MFGIDFYPTPAEVIDRMLMGVEVAGKFVLEPSAGSGNIVRALQKIGAREVLACEIDPRLRKILSGDCTVIADDFLTVTSEQVSHVDLIVMNPPFSQAEKHILHAFDIAPDGCEIISLCNSDMLKRSYFALRQKINEFIEANGFADSFGECFRSSERSTDVSISCIRVWKPKHGDAEFEDYLDGMSDAEEYDGGSVAGVMPYNAIRDIVNRYVAAVKRFDAVMDASREINDLTSFFASCPVKFGARWTGDRDSHVDAQNITRDTFKKELQKSAWKTIFEKMDMSRYVTASVREDINRYVERQTNVPFTMHNIFRMLEMIVGTNAERMKRTLVEAFETICSFSAENSTAGEKWKTNSDYMINKRVIVPGITECNSWGDSSRMVRIQSRYDKTVAKIDDLIRAMCYITGRKYVDEMGLYRFVNSSKFEWGQWYEQGHYEEHKEVDENGKTVRKSVFVPGFFRIRGYKKGTMHFEFLDDEVWAKFNIEVAKIKGWQLPKMRTKK